MSLDFAIGACSVKAVLLDGDDRGVAAAGCRAIARRTRIAWRRAWRVETSGPTRAAATFTASRAHRRRLAPIAKEISQ